jgi:hypothetical protein
VSLYRAPGEYARFGDIFEAAHLFSAYLRADAVQLGAKELPAKLVPLLGKKLGTTLAEEPLPLYSPNLTPRADDDFVLAHGQVDRAILVSDNCSVSTIFGYDRDKPRRTGRLLFAAVRDEPKAEIDKVVNLRPFNRFGLQEAAFFSGGIVDFRRLFVVEARDVLPEQRIASLGDALVEELEVRFAAYAVRRGPNVVDKNLDKVVRLLDRAGLKEPEAKAAAAQISLAFAIAWRAEGGPLEDAAEAFDDEKEPAEPVAALAAELRALEEAAREGAAALEQQLVQLS